LALAQLAFTGPPYLNNDALWALQWGQQVAHGHAPNIQQPASPTAHPLTNVLAGILSLAGPTAAYWLFAGLVLLSWGALVVLVFDIARRLHGVPAGLIAAVIVATSPALIDFSASAHPDTVFVAVVLGAVALALRARTWQALGVLVVAGLMRPEAWLLSGAYALWLLVREPAFRTPRAMLGVVALVAAPPVIWLALDGALTHAPLYSLTHTQRGADRLGRTTGITHVPGTARVGLESILSRPVLVGGALGFLAALHARRSALLLALGLASGVTYALYGLANVSLLNRYLLLPGVVLSVTFAYSLTGFVRASGTRRVVWALGALLFVLYALTAVPGRWDALRGERARVRASAAAVADLRRINHVPAARAVLHGCRRLLVRDQRPVALLADVLPRSPQEIVDVGTTRPGAGDAFVTATATAMAGNRLALFPDVASAESRPSTFRVRYTTARFELSSGGRC
jgi:hypothetical protein